jgi:hypothetical protein
MRQAKIGAIFLMLIITLAGVGAGYAAWTDKIMIDGRINTGSVDIEVKGYSGTWVWKNLTDDSTEITNSRVPPPGCIYVAGAWSEQFADINGVLIDDRVQFIYENLFPCVNFMADLWLHYNGTIPGKINILGYNWWSDWVVFPDGTEGYWLDWLMNYEMGVHFVVDMIIVRTHLDGTSETFSFPNGVGLEGFQLHHCDNIYFYFTIHIPQEAWFDVDDDGDLELVQTDFLQNVQGGGFFDFQVIQWNEY